MVISDKTQSIPYLRPHYTNSAFSIGMKTVFLASGYKLKRDNYGYDKVVCKGIEYNYSDRIWQWDWEKARQAQEQTRELYERNDSGEAIEHFLRLYFDDNELELVHIMSGVNRSSGYDYQVYGYVKSIPESKD